MLHTLLGAGFADSPQDVQILVAHLLDVGAQVTGDTRKDYRSELQGPQGRVRVFSTWKIIQNGDKYLATIKLIPA